MSVADLLRRSRAAGLMRLDEFAEDDHPRDESGRFAPAGGHASEAESHATRARTSAAGTTPAARAGARRAEASAALSRAAAGHGDVEGARRHAEEARRHADAVVAKIAGAGVAKVTPKMEPASKASEVVVARDAASPSSPEPSTAGSRATPLDSTEQHVLAQSLTSLSGVGNQRMARDLLNQSLAHYGFSPNSRKSSDAKIQVTKAFDGVKRGVRPAGTYNPVNGEIHVLPTVAVNAAEALRKVASGEKPKSFEMKDYKTLVHETLHGHGPQSTFQGGHAVTEEVATEVTARRVARDVFGPHAVAAGGDAFDMPRHQGSPGSYSKWIYNVTDALAGTLPRSSSPMRDAYSKIERAAMDYKRVGGDHDRFEVFLSKIPRDDSSDDEHRASVAAVREALSTQF